MPTTHKRDEFRCIVMILCIRQYDGLSRTNLLDKEAH